MKVLQISMGEVFGGIEKLELDILKNIDKSIEIDFLTPNSNPFKNYQVEIKKYKSNVYDFNLSRKSFINRIKYAYYLNRFLKNNKYDVVHINSSVFLFSFHVALISKIRRVGLIIAHSHSIPKMGLIKRIIKFIFNPLYVLLVDKFLACSREASKSLLINRYVSRCIIIKNGIDIKDYKFNNKLRDKYRREYGLDKKIVYGFVGRFEKEKNMLFLINLFSEITKIQSNSYLLLIGDGSLKGEIESKVIQLNLLDKVLFLGNITNVYELLNSMDVFIMPSISEGLGISLIEAQANGLIVYGSSSIPNEVVVSNNFKYFNLNDNISDIALSIVNSSVSINRNELYKSVIKSGYDIKNTCRKLENIYKS